MSRKPNDTEKALGITPGLCPGCDQPDPCDPPCEFEKTRVLIQNQVDAEFIEKFTSELGDDPGTQRVGEEFARHIYDGLGVPEDSRHRNTKYSTSSLRLDELERQQSRERQIVLEVMKMVDEDLFEKVRGILDWKSKMDVALDKWREGHLPDLLIGKNVEFSSQPLAYRIEGESLEVSMGCHVPGPSDCPICAEKKLAVEDPEDG